jgi:hypothetical protein
MRGSIRRRGRTYTWYLFVLDPATGKPRQRSKGGYRTKRDCQAALNDALTTVRTGTFVEASKRTTGSFLRDEWLPAMRLNVRPSTWASYQGLLEAYVIPTLGRMELQQFTPCSPGHPLPGAAGLRSAPPTRRPRPEDPQERPRAHPSSP